MDADDIDTCEEMTRTISHTDIMKEAYHLLELEEVVPGRANIAAVHFDEQPNSAVICHIEMVDPISPKSSRRSVSKRCHHFLPTCESRRRSARHRLGDEDRLPDTVGSHKSGIVDMMSFIYWLIVSQLRSESPHVQEVPLLMAIDVSPRGTEDNIELSIGLVEALLHLLDGATLIFYTLHAFVDILKEVSVAARIIQSVNDHIIALVSRKIVSAKRQPDSSSCSCDN
jgi:hypothetical protein